MSKLNEFFRSTDIILRFGSLGGIASVRYFLGAILNGSTQIVNADPFSPSRYFELVDRFKVTMTYTSTYAIHRILQHPGVKTANFNSIRLWCFSGSNISTKVVQKMSEYLKNGHACNTYGITELFGIIACNLEHTDNNCVGQLIGGCEAIIVNDHGERVGVNKIGEICIKFPFPFLGYLNNTQGIECYVDENGFFLTGDEGYFDESGDLFVDDRKKEIFKCNGSKVPPMEMEAFLNDIDGVKQSCVVPIPVETVGYVPAAVIVKDKSSNCTEQSIYDAVSSRVQYNVKRLWI